MTVEEIRAIRIVESEKIRNMSRDEILEYSRSRGGEFMRQALENKKRKEIERSKN